MAGSITTYSYCAVKLEDNKAFIGTKEEIVFQICKIEIKENNIPYFKVKGFVEERGCNYSDEFTVEEIKKEVIERIWKHLPYYHYKVFRDIGF
jgi:hypothetical protein